MGWSVLSALTGCIWGHGVLLAIEPSSSNVSILKLDKKDCIRNKKKCKMGIKIAVPAKE